MTRVITITSGKGGVGKTSITLNLALSMAEKGFRVAVFDADLGLANINILTGIYPEKHLVDVLKGRCKLEDIIIRDYKGIDIIPGSTGIEKLADLGPRISRKLIKSFLSLDAYDYIFFDTSAGISAQVLSFCMASNEIYIVVTGQPTSLTDAYSMMKVLSKAKYKNSINIILNQINSAEEARHIYTRLENTVKKFLSFTLKPAGIVVSDRQVGMAVKAQIPFVLLFPDSNAARCIHVMADKISRSRHGQNLSMNFFWEKCFSFLYHDSQKAGNYEIVGIDAETDDGMYDGINASTAMKEKEASFYKEIQKKLDKIESGFFELAGQFNNVSELIESRRESRSKVLDFEQWLKNKPV